jgi:hypothetical protein
VPDAGAYLYLKRLLVGRPIPTHLVPPERLLRVTRLTVTAASVFALAGLLWLAPWPVDAFAGVAAAAAWTSWIDGEEQR